MAGASAFAFADAELVVLAASEAVDAGTETETVEVVLGATSNSDLVVSVVGLQEAWSPTSGPKPGSALG